MHCCAFCPFKLLGTEGVQVFLVYSMHACCGWHLCTDLVVYFDILVVIFTCVNVRVLGCIVV